MLELSDQIPLGIKHFCLMIFCFKWFILLLSCSIVYMSPFTISFVSGAFRIPVARPVHFCRSQSIFYKKHAFNVKWIINILLSKFRYWGERYTIGGAFGDSIELIEPPVVARLIQSSNATIVAECEIHLSHMIHVEYKYRLPSNLLSPVIHIRLKT